MLIPPVCNEGVSFIPNIRSRNYFLPTLQHLNTLLGMILKPINYNLNRSCSVRIDCNNQASFVRQFLPYHLATVLLLHLGSIASIVKGGGVAFGVYV